jgi:hypothetical protein
VVSKGAHIAYVALTARIGELSSIWDSPASCEILKLCSHICRPARSSAQALSKSAWALLRAGLRLRRFQKEPTALTALQKALEAPTNRFQGFRKARAAITQRPGRF